MAYLHSFDTRPLLHRVIGVAYGSMRLQTVLVVLALVAASEFDRLQRYVIAVAVALAMTLTVFAVLPAGNIYTGLDISPKDFPNLPLVGTFDHVAPLAAARDGAGFTIDFNALVGLISFPSFHTASAIMFSWALFSLPALRWGVIGLNILLVAATPIDGGHYFIDLAGGAVVALVAILCAGLLQRARVPSVRLQMVGRPDQKRAAQSEEDG